MSDIKQALGRLNESIDSVEAVARHTQGKFQKLLQKAANQSGSQRDLFAVAGAGVANGTNGNVEYMAFDPAVLARKLDIAIEKVEQILREG